MTRIRLSLVFCVFVAQACLAQSLALDLPRQSQHATVSQRIGITDVTINYHRPLAGDRKIWGTLVPYGEVWRAGANENTTITFSDPVTIEGKPLDKGTYGLHMIPNQNEWVVIFSKNSTAWGSFTYDQKEDALRVSVKPQPGEMHNALTYDFDQLTPDSAVATLRWEKVAVPFKVGVDVNHVMAESLPNQLRGLAQYTWFGWDEAATYLIDNKGDLQQALKYEDRSIQNEERFENLLTKARILDQLGRKDEAKADRDKAMALANSIQLHGYARQLQGQNKPDEAYAIFRQNAQKHPNDWIVHVGLSRLYSGQGNFDGAVKEMKIAIAGAPDQQKPFLERFITRLQSKDDINK
jgi:tetratricopeptide (TPR) repeat protein